MRMKTGAGPAEDEGGTAKRSATDDGGVVEKRPKGQNPHVFFDIHIGGKCLYRSSAPWMHCSLATISPL